MPLLPSSVIEKTYESDKIAVRHTRVVGRCFHDMAHSRILFQVRLGLIESLTLPFLLRTIEQRARRTI